MLQYGICSKVRWVLSFTLIMNYINWNKINKKGVLYDNWIYIFVNTPNDINMMVSETSKMLLVLILKHEIFAYKYGKKRILGIRQAT